MNVGKLNKQIVIQSFTSTRDNNGGEVKTWADYATVWATPKYNFGNETDERGRETAMTQVDFTIREDRDKTFTELMRVSFDSEYFYIQNVFRYPSNDMILLKTEKRK